MGASWDDHSHSASGLGLGCTARTRCRRVHHSPCPTLAMLAVRVVPRHARRACRGPLIVPIDLRTDHRAVRGVKCTARTRGVETAAARTGGAAKGVEGWRSSSSRSCAASSASVIKMLGWMRTSPSIWQSMALYRLRWAGVSKVPPPPPPCAVHERAAHEPAARARYTSAAHERGARAQRLSAPHMYLHKTHMGGPIPTPPKKGGGCQLNHAGRAGANSSIARARRASAPRPAARVARGVRACAQPQEHTPGRPAPKSRSTSTLDSATPPASRWLACTGGCGAELEWRVLHPRGMERGHPRRHGARVAASALSRPAPKSRSTSTLDSAHIQPRGGWLAQGAVALSSSGGFCTPVAWSAATRADPVPALQPSVASAPKSRSTSTLDSAHHTSSFEVVGLHRGLWR